MWFRDPHLVLEPVTVKGSVEVAVTWGPSGEIRTLHPTDHDLSEPLDIAVTRIRSALLPQPNLLRPVFQRIRVTGSEAEILPGLHCLPHVQHSPHEPPRHPGATRVLGGGVIPRAWVDYALRVRLRVSPYGELLEVIPEEGNDDLLPRVHHALAETRFDPALLNGEPIVGELDLVFVFDPG